MKKNSKIFSSKLLSVMLVLIAVVMASIISLSSCGKKDKDNNQGENTGNVDTSSDQSPTDDNQTCENHQYGEWVITKAATCTEEGTKKQFCNKCDAVREEKINALGHTEGAPATETEPQVCTVCGTVLAEATGHKLTKVSAKEPNCSVDGNIEYYSCSICKKNFSDAEGKNQVFNTVKSKTGHKWDIENPNDMQDQTCTVCGHTNKATGHILTSRKWIEDGEPVLIDAATCKYEQRYTGCANDNCAGHTEIVYLHSVKAEITTNATCQADGEITYKCSVCNKEIKKENFSDPTAHNWNEGVLSGDEKIFTCKEDGCGAKKTQYTGNSAVVPSDKLDSEIELDHASMTVDQSIKDALSGQDVSLSADKLNIGDIDVNNPLLDDKSLIFDFALNADGAPVDFNGGKVTVKIPYTLEEGDDPDNIAVFYINNDGELEAYTAKYSNGYVVFEAEHFSRYSVTRLSPAQRCEVYGHNYTETVYKATCIDNGYTLKVCNRCREVVIDNFVEAEGHKYTVSDKIEATCTSSGSATLTCSVCNETHKEIYNQKSHAYVDTIVPMTCTQDGYTKRVCTTCNYEMYDNFIASVGHKYDKTVVSATCTERGYTTYTCSVCKVSMKADFVEAHHTWNIEKATCGESKVCTVCNAIGEKATGNHTLADGICTVCGKGCDHSYNKTVVAPTCTEAGYDLNKCTKCGREEKINYKPATGHKGTYVCETCGANILPEDFFKQLAHSMATDSFGITVNNIEFEIPLEENVKVKVSFAEFSVATNKDAKSDKIGESIKVSAYGTAIADITVDGVQGKAVGDAVVEDNVLYLKLTLNQGKQETMYVQLNFADLINQSIDTGDESSEGLNLIITNLPAIQEYVTTKVLPLAEKIENFAWNSTHDANVKLMSKFFTMKNENGKYTFTFNFGAISDMLDCETVGDVFEYLYGKGSFDNFVNDIVNNLDKPIVTLLKELKDKGIDYNEIISVVNDGIKVFVDMSYPDEEIPTITIDDIIASKIGDEGFTIAGFIKDLKNSSLLDIFVASQEGATKAQIKEQIKAMAKEIADKPIIDLFKSGNDQQQPGQVDKPVQVDKPSTMADEPSPEQILESAKAVIEFIKEKASFSFVTDASGKLDSADLKVNISDVPDMEGLKVIIDISFKNGYKTNANYEVKKNEIISFVKKININKGSFPVNGNKNLSYTFDKDGNIETITFVRKNLINQYNNGEKIIREYEITTKVYDFSKVYGYMISPDCNNGSTEWYSVELLTNDGTAIVEEVVEYEYVLNKDTGKYEEKEISRKVRNNYVSSYNIGFLYDAKNNKVKIKVDNYGNFVTESLHRYVNDESLFVSATGCEGVGKRFYTCENCGDSYVELFTNGHRNIEYTYEFDNKDSHSCEDGVTVTAICKDCGKVAFKKHVTHHETFSTKIDLSKYCVCGINHYDQGGNFVNKENAYLEIYSCACGEWSDYRIVSDCDIHESYGFRQFVVDSNNVELSDEFGTGNTKWFEIRFGRCSVTEPECGFSYIEYYDFKVDGCKVTVRHMIGIAPSDSGKVSATIVTEDYDDKTGNYLYKSQIFKFEEVYCFDEYTYHTGAYAKEQEITPYVDSEGYTVTGTRYSCGKCGEAKENLSYVKKNVEYKKTVDGFKYISKYEIWNKYENYVVYSLEEFAPLATADKEYPYVVYLTHQKKDTIFKDTKPNGGNGNVVIAGEKYDKVITKDEKSCLYTITYNPGDAQRQETAKTCYVPLGNYLEIANMLGLDTSFMNLRVDETWKYDNYGSNRWFLFGEIIDGEYIHSTCTQSGSDSTLCAICQGTYVSLISAHGYHSWGYDPEKGMYVCHNCGMENANGADGSIILEDLTNNERFAEKGKLVIGYYVRKGEFDGMYEIKVVLNFLNENGEEDSRVLDISVTDDMFSTVKIDLNEILGSIAENEKPIDITISFVPTGADKDLDYSIVLDDLFGTNNDDDKSVVVEDLTKEEGTHSGEGLIFKVQNYELVESVELVFVANTAGGDELTLSNVLNYEYDSNNSIIIVSYENYYLCIEQMDEKMPQDIVIDKSSALLCAAFNDNKGETITIDITYLIME